MASIKKRPDGSYRARYRDADGREHSKHFERKIEAQHWLDGVTAALVRGDYCDPAPAKITFGEYAERWRNAQVWRKSSAAKVESHFRHHILPRFADRPIASIRPSGVQAFVRELADNLAPRTVRSVYTFFASAMRAAVADSVIPSSPCVGVKLPKIEHKRVVPLSIEQIQAIADAMPERYSALVVLAAGTGLRQGEALGITLDRVDFLRRNLTVDRQIVVPSRGEPTLAPTKTTASVRTVPLPDVVLDALVEHLRHFPAEPDGLIFTNKHGKAIRSSAGLNQWLHRAVAEAGAPSETTFHDLRHHYASLLIRHGASV